MRKVQSKVMAENKAMLFLVRFAMADAGLLRNILRRAMMSWKNTHHRYGYLTISLHWLMLILLVAVYASIELREFFPKGSDPRAALKALHFMLGLSVLGFALLRLGVRLSGPTPRIVPEPGRWEKRSAKFMHIALYVLMIAMPLAGWLILSAAGKPIPFFGLQLPALIGENKDLAKQIEEVHEVVGTAGYFLIGLHAAAALFHHYIKRDNTLVRILPGRDQAGVLNTVQSQSRKSGHSGHREAGQQAV